MVSEIEFTARNYDVEGHGNWLCQLTKNTIILCNNYCLMDMLCKEIVGTINGSAEYNNYVCDDTDIGVARVDIRFGLQRLIRINDQTITLSIEPAIVYKAKCVEDIWFFETVLGKPVNQLYALSEFRESENDWAVGLDNIYRNVVGGRYGAYDGNWIDLGDEN